MHRIYPPEVMAAMRRTARRQRAHLRHLQLKTRVLAYGLAAQEALERERNRSTGYTWRGWWYPRELVHLGAGVAAIVLVFALLAFVLHSTNGA